MNGFILVFGMALVLAVERRFAADRAAVGGPARSRQSPPRGRVPTRSRQPCLWSGTRPQPATPRPWAVAVPWPGARALADGKMLAKCVPQRPTVAIYRRHAFPGVRSWQDYAVVRYRAAIRGSFFASCVPEGASDGKNASSWQDSRAMYPK